jgi:hypothetical protein
VCSFPCLFGHKTACFKRSISFNLTLKKGGQRSILDYKRQCMNEFLSTYICCTRLDDYTVITAGWCETLFLPFLNISFKHGLSLPTEDITWDLTFSWRWWRCCCSGLWRRVDTNVSDKHTVSIFRAKVAELGSGGILYGVEGGGMK